MTRELQREVLEEKLNKLLSQHIKTYRAEPYAVWKMIEEVAFENIKGYL